MFNLNDKLFSKYENYWFFLQWPRIRFLFIAGSFTFAQIRTEITLARTVLGEIMDHCELYNGGENEGEREENEEIQGSGVRNFWQIGSRLQSQKCHR